MCQCFLYFRYLHSTFIVNKIKKANFNHINISNPVFCQTVTDYKDHIATEGGAGNFSQYISSSSRSKARGKNLPLADTFDTHVLEEQRGIIPKIYFQFMAESCQ